MSRAGQLFQSCRAVRTSLEKRGRTGVSPSCSGLRVGRATHGLASIAASAGHDLPIGADGRESEDMPFSLPRTECAHSRINFDGPAGHDILCARLRRTSPEQLGCRGGWGALVARAQQAVVPRPAALRQPTDVPHTQSQAGRLGNGSCWSPRRCCRAHQRLPAGAAEDFGKPTHDAQVKSFSAVQAPTTTAHRWAKKALNEHGTNPTAT